MPERRQRKLLEMVKTLSEAGILSHLSQEQKDAEVVPDSWDRRLGCLSGLKTGVRQLT